VSKYITYRWCFSKDNNSTHVIMEHAVIFYLNSRCMFSQRAGRLCSVILANFIVVVQSVVMDVVQRCGIWCQLCSSAITVLALILRAPLGSGFATTLNLSYDI
jgi:hypothetical protein